MVMKESPSKDLHACYSNMNFHKSRHRNSNTPARNKIFTAHMIH